jgi:hypothetical protein
MNPLVGTWAATFLHADGLEHALTPQALGEVRE